MFKQSKEVREYHLSAQVFSFALHAFAIFVLIYYDSPLSIQIRQNDLLYPIILFICIIIELYLCLITGKEPGIVSTIQENHIMVTDEEDNNLAMTNASIEQPQPLNLEVGSTKNFPPLKFFCHKCNKTQPYRTKHCNKCQACIAKYDHHCFWIGELNRRLCR